MTGQFEVRTRCPGRIRPILSEPEVMAQSQARIGIGIVTVSDRASAGIYEDRGGPAVEQWLRQTLTTDFEAHKAVVPDDPEQLEEALVRMCDQQRCCLVVTTGGTGPARRDITPDVTARVCDKILDGFGEQMRAASLKIVPTAILSRQLAGIRGQTLIINLPGKPAAIADCLGAVFAAVPYCIDLLEGPYIETDPAQIQAFRPGRKN